jgi:starch synthase
VTNSNPSVLMVAAECRGLAKVGGLADVVRDLSKALETLHIPVGIVMPCYDQMLPRDEPWDSFPVRFGSRIDWPVQVFRRELDGVTFHRLRSEEFFGGSYGQVYIDSDRLGRGPFEDDAKRFAFFSAAVLEFIQHHPELATTALHCHDWHTGALLVLLRHDPRYRELARKVRTLFTIHNLDYQGTRPFELTKEPESRELLSFAEWFPELYQGLSKQDLELLADPLAPISCFNPMRAGINLADDVNTVSPTYAREIAQPDDPARNFIGGRGLEGDLQRRGQRLYGILNGLDYTANDPSKLAPPFDANIGDWSGARRQHKLDLLENLEPHLKEMASRLGERFKNSDTVLRKLSAFQPVEWREKLLVVAVTRAVHQKMNILLETLDDSTSVLQTLTGRDLYFILFGTGELETELEELNRSRNGLFVCAFDPRFADRLYAAGDLFLMPSDFEPCGISQMIAMRYGCLPLVANVGGLSDTVHEGQTGFVYSGVNRQAARRALLEALDRARSCYLDDRSKWREMQARAMSTRFEWTVSAEQYVKLYRA